jgi:hypothetical protein
LLPLSVSVMKPELKLCDSLVTVAVAKFSLCSLKLFADKR